VVLGLRLEYVAVRVAIGPVDDGTLSVLLEDGPGGLYAASRLLLDLDLR